MLPSAAMKTADFSFNLPEELIAQYPPEQRGESRLLSLNHTTSELQDHAFSVLPALLQPGDVLVFNNTRVIPARLYGHKTTGGQVEILIERVLSETTAQAQIKASKSPKTDSEVILDEGIQLRVTGRDNDLFLLQSRQPMMEILQQYGHMPLPPYIDREDELPDQSRYQTVYAEHDGAVAAPTAGLHFTETLLKQLAQANIKSAFLTLHVGAGTFQPVRVDDVTQHTMHSEHYLIDQLNCDKINAAKDAGNRVIAVGTTSVRVLEKLAGDGKLNAAEGETDIFIYPGYEFKIVDAMITNFHLPESTLLMLVSAFAGKENILSAYQHAISKRYRFFSYGDAMLIT